MITRLLIANRGEIACRIAATASRMGIQSVAVYADPDVDALHVRTADIGVPLPGTTAAQTYLDSDALLAAARFAGADAIHPGYGFLAENAAFAQAVIAAGLVWVGPPPKAITAMGDKLAAKRLMTAAGVPTLVSVTDPDQAEEVGYPLIVKAAAGGGGKGMRVVDRPEDLNSAVESARREARAAFGDDTVFLERYVRRPRHIEVQVLADRHGAVVHLGERECSLQRRHQKVIEESPSPVVDATTRRRLGAAAVAAVSAVDYEGAGTVEFVATQGREGLDFFFLEVNTRLQVEHPVTEEAWRIAGIEGAIDLVRLQLMIAEGLPLPFGQDDLRPAAHSIEARLYAEDPAAGFLPATGTVELLEQKGLHGTRWDTGVVTGDEVSPYFDPMIAKVIATAPTRREACRLLAAELQGTRLHGVTTNRDALVAMIRHPAFIAGDLHTGFIQEHLTAADLAGAPSAECIRAHAVAATLVSSWVRRAQAPVLATIPSGWRNNRSASQSLTFDGVGSPVTVTYDAPARLPGAATMAIDGDEVTVEVRRLDGHHADVVVNGRRLDIAVSAIGPSQHDTTWAVDSSLGHTRLQEVPRFPVVQAAQEQGSLAAPMPGSIISIAVSVGDVVVVGDPLLVLEAMKMEHPITAPNAGVVASLPVRVGEQVSAGDVLAVIDDDSIGADEV